MYLRLSDTDRKAFGLDEEWMYWENGRFTNREARLLERPEPDGPGVGPEDWMEALRGEIVEVDGIPQVDEETGEPIRKPSADTWDAIVWLCLRRNGVEVTWQAFEYDRNYLGYRPDHELEPDEELEAESGKDEPVAEDSATPS
jgi:hypothetical protein